MSLPHFQSSDNPKLLLVSGTHGDEYQVINALSSAIKEHEDVLPSFLHVPELSPSAVAQQTRHNSEGLVLNRHFFEDSPSQEVQAVVSLLADQSFRLVLDFHEDYERSSSCYFYDSQQFSDGELRDWIDFSDRHGIKRFTGMDDDSDPTLGFQINEGYFGTPSDIDLSHHGFFMDWLTQNKIADRIFCIEVPGAAPLAEKHRIASLFLKFFIENHL